MQALTNLSSEIRSALSPMSRPGQLLATLSLVGVLVLSSLLRGGHEEQRLLQLVLLALFAVAACVRGNWAASLIGSKLTPLHWSLIAVFVLGALSSARAFSLRHALYELASLFILLMLALYVAGEIARERARSMMLALQIYGLGCALYAFKILVVYVSVLFIGLQPDVGAFAPGFNNHRFLNHTQTLTLPMLVLLGILNRSGDRIRWLWFALGGLWWALLLLSAARGSIVGLVVGTAIAVAVRGRFAGAFLRTMLLTALAGVAIYVVFFVFVPLAFGLRPFGEVAHVVGRSISDPTSGRLALWGRALELIAANPGLGVGPLHFAHHAVDVQSGAHPHSWVLQIASEWGIPALVCLCLAVGLAMAGLVRTARFISADDVRNHHILVTWIAIGTAILVDGMVSGLIVMPVSQLLIAFYIACASGWSMSLRSPGAGPERLSGARRAFIAIVLPASVFCLAYGVGPDLGPRIGNEALTKNEAALNHGTFWPRIWIAGYF